MGYVAYVKVLFISFFFPPCYIDIWTLSECYQWMGSKILS